MKNADDFLAGDALPLGDGVRVVTAHPAGIIALEKPEKILAHPNKSAESAKSLIRAPYNHDGEFYTVRHNDAVTKIYLLNRIDSPTSGLILVATNAEIAARVKNLFRENAVTKTYFAIVKGRHLQPASGVWKDFLAKSGGDGVVRATAGKHGFPAITHYAWIRADAQKRGLSLVRLEPKTGRTHQLRVQSAARGFPILGDKTYGDFSFNRLRVREGVADRLFLHSAAIKFSFAANGKTETFFAETKLPVTFEAALGAPSPSSAKQSDAAVTLSPRLKIRVTTRQKRA